MAKIHTFAKDAELARSAKGLSQAEVAEAADISVRHYQKIINEGSEPSLPVSIRIAAVLEISLDQYVSALAPDESKVYRKPTKKADKKSQ